MAGASSIGSLGQVVFQVSNEYVKTYEALSRTSRAVYADHEVVKGKPASEYTGPDLDDVKMKFVFNATLGVSPREETETLREMLASGSAYPLLIGSNVWGDFTLREIGETHIHSLRGEPLVVSVNVAMREYVESLPGPGSQAAARDAASRGVTGCGGPVKIPGASEPMQSRSCQARG